jgi:hypothetical protein
MRLLASIGLITLFVAFAPALAGLSAVPGALLAVTLFVALASAVGGGLSPASLVAGAGAALVSSALVERSPVLAGALALALVFAPRCLYLRGGRRVVAVHLSLAAAGGALSAWVTGLYPVEVAGLATWSVAVLVGALLASAPFLLPTDDLLAAKLEGLSRRMSGTARWRFERAAALRRRMMEDDLEIPRKERRRIVSAFSALVRLGRPRLMTRSADADGLDAVIGEHLTALERSFQVLVARAVAVASSSTAAAEALDEHNLSVEAEAEAYAAVAAPRGGRSHP